jgi:hypothetical protein
MVQVTGPVCTEEKKAKYRNRGGGTGSCLMLGKFGFHGRTVLTYGCKAVPIVGREGPKVFE